MVLVIPRACVCVFLCKHLITPSKYKLYLAERFISNSLDIKIQKPGFSDFLLNFFSYSRQKLFFWYVILKMWCISGCGCKICRLCEANLHGGCLKLTFSSAVDWKNLEKKNSGNSLMVWAKQDRTERGMLLWRSSRFPGWTAYSYFAGEILRTFSFDFGRVFFFKFSLCF